jgi:hypothetical protein
LQDCSTPDDCSKPSSPAAAVLDPRNRWEKGLCKFADSHGIRIREVANGFCIDEQLVYNRFCVYDSLKSRRQDSRRTPTERSQGLTETERIEALFNEPADLAWPASRLTRGDLSDLRELRWLTQRPLTQLIQEAVRSYVLEQLTEDHAEESSRTEQSGI